MHRSEKGVSEAHALSCYHEPMLLAKVKIIFIILVSFIILVFLMVYNEQPLLGPELVIYFEKGGQPAVSAQAWLIFDPSTGAVFDGKNINSVLPIASLVKLMTALAYVESSDLNATYTIAYSDVITEGRAGKLQAGEVYTGRELLYPLLLESSNDAAATLLRHQENLLAEMNQTAKDIDLVDTYFADPAGLSAQNVSTAHDIGKLLSHLYLEKPHILDISRLPVFYSESNGWINNNPYITDHSYLGGKHGFIYEANRTAGVLFTESMPNNKIYTFGYVLLGSDDLVADMKVLRDYVRTHARYE